jgi:hypothetical protein
MIRWPSSIDSEVALQKAVGQGAGQQGLAIDVRSILPQVGQSA